MYTLHNRYQTEDGDLIIRALHERTGAVVDIHVRPEDAELAAGIWGGHRVPTVTHAGKLWYYRAPDLLTDAELDALDREIRNREAREIAPDATDEQLDEIFTRPMSLSQRIRALQKLASASYSV